MRGRSSTFVLAIVAGTAASVQAGCVGDAPDKTPPDAAVEAGSDVGSNDAGQTDGPADVASDAADAGPSCDLKKPFDPPVLLAGVNTAAYEANGRLSDNERTIYFVRGPAPEDIFVATRASITDAFGPAVPLPVVNSANRESTPTTTEDGKMLVFNSDRVGGQFHLYVATRSSTLQDFGTPNTMSGVNGNAQDYDAFLAWDGSEIVFGSSRTGVSALYLAKFNGSSFVSPTPITELNTPQSATAPVLSSDGLTIYWYSTRVDLGGGGEGDIFMAQRPATGQPFANIKRVTELNSPQSDTPSWLSKDGCRMYIHSDRTGSALSDVWIATRPK